MGLVSQQKGKRPPTKQQVTPHQVPDFDSVSRANDAITAQLAATPIVERRTFVTDLAVGSNRINMDTTSWTNPKTGHCEIPSDPRVYHGIPPDEPGIVGWCEGINPLLPSPPAAPAPTPPAGG